MRICFLSFEFPPFVLGGAGIYASNITNELSKLGHEVHVLSPSCNIENGVFRSNSIRHYIPIAHKRFLNIPSFWLKLVRKYNHICKAVGGFDILHSNVISDFSLCNWQVKTPRVVTVHHLSRLVAKKMPLMQRIFDISSETGFVPLIEKSVISRSDKIIAVSNYTKNNLISVYDICPSRIKVIHNGINLKEYKTPENEAHDYKKSLGLGDYFTFLFVGRLNDPRKNLPLLLKAFQIICKHRKNVRLVLVGSCVTSNLMETLRILGIENEVHVLGYVDGVTLKKCYSFCDALVSSSLLEGFGLVLLEAMASGKPVVAINGGAVSELVKNHVNGILVENPNPLELANSMTFLVENPDVVKKIGKINIEKASEFSWAKSAEHTEQVYNSLLT